MSGGGFFNRFVKYSEVKFEGEWNISGGLPLLLTPPGFVTLVLTQKSVEGKLERGTRHRKGTDHAKGAENLYKGI